MGTIQSGQRADGGLDRRLRRTEDDVRQLRERWSRPQKIPTGGAFPIGQTRATAGSLHQSNTTQSAIYGQDWTFANVGGEGPTLTEAANGFLTVADAGCYLSTVTFRGGWSSPNVPAWFQVSADYDGNTGEFPRWRRSPNSNDSNFAEAFQLGPWYLDAGAGLWFGAEWLTGDVFFLDALTVEVTLLG